MNTDLAGDRPGTVGGVFIDRTDRVRIEVTGPDRAKFLHNLTTNEVKRLPVGQGVEAFVTSPQGKTLGYVTLLATDASILVRTDPGGADRFLPHLQKYGIFDAVALDDLSGRTFEFHLAGHDAERAVAQTCGDLPGPGELVHVVATIERAGVRIVREAPLGAAGLTIIGDVNDAGAVRDALRTAGASGWSEIDRETAEALRIEAGTPVFGRDVTAENLPQEVARDDRAINFVKGCYLGQETVARIDALGHVNKLLRLLAIQGGAGDVPPAGSVIEADGKTVGTITSSAFSRARGYPVALGYVRLAHAGAGTPVRVVTEGVSLAAEVVEPPHPRG